MIEFAPLSKEPPSSRGPGRIPFKDKTGVRISVGALLEDLLPCGSFVFNRLNLENMFSTAGYIFFTKTL
jgi:hypothetical protein